MIYLRNSQLKHVPPDPLPSVVGIDGHTHRREVSRRELPRQFKAHIEAQYMGDDDGRHISVLRDR